MAKASDGEAKVGPKEPGFWSRQWGGFQFVMYNKVQILLIAVVICIIFKFEQPAMSAEAEKTPADIKKEILFKRPEGLVNGGAFVDLIKPIPVDGSLTTNCWGGDNVKPRVVNNGMDDPQWSYFCISGISGPDGKEHVFTSRWPQNKGHWDWVRSQLVHAVGDKPTGPFKVIEEMGPGSNVDVYQTTNGTYEVTVSGRTYRSKNINGPWTVLIPEFDVKEQSMSNKTFARREDGSFLMVIRSGSLWLSDDGLKPYRRIFPGSLYPFYRVPGSTSFEDPCFWRDEVQYHLIINNWPLRTAFYGRSKDGLHWTWDQGTAFDNNVVRHPDGTVEGWHKTERPKVRQDEFGRATHLYLAAMDAPKDEITGTSVHSSKSVVIPLVVGRRLAILNDKAITADTTEIKVEIKAEPGFNPQTDVDVKTLTFGAPALVDFGKGCKALKSEPSGKNLVVTFGGRDNGLKESDFVAKLIGRLANGELLFGFVRLPGQSEFDPTLVARMPQINRNADGSLKVTVPIENAGLAESISAAVVKLKVSQPKKGNVPKKELFSTMASSAVPPLKPYASTNVEFQVPAGIMMDADNRCHMDVIINPDGPNADTFPFKRDLTFTLNEPMCEGPFQPEWQSLGKYPCPDWFRDAKFGIWAHLGPSCEPEMGEYAQGMYKQGSAVYKFHLEHYGHPSEFGFKDVCNVWKADKFDPEKLIALYKKAGAKYFVALASYHDNFDNWNSKHQPWNSVAVGPKKDLIGMWAKAARAAGLPFGVTVHAARSWNWFQVAHTSDYKEGSKVGVSYDGCLTLADGRGKWWEGLDPAELYGPHKDARTRGAQKAYEEKFVNRVFDLVTQYKPDLLYFDDEVLPLVQSGEIYGLSIAAHLYNTSAKVNNGRNEAVMNCKELNGDHRKALVLDIEFGKSETIDPIPWQTDMCIGGWQYNRSIYDKKGYKSAQKVVQVLIDVVSRNGNLLLNIPLRGDGSIDEEEVKILEGIAKWMDVNHECIYGTRPFVVCGEGPSIGGQEKGGSGEVKDASGRAYSAQDIRFTTKGKTLYGVLMAWPQDGKATIKTLANGSEHYKGDIADVKLLGSEDKLTFERTDAGLVVMLPAQKPCDYAYALKITPKE